MKYKNGFTLTEVLLAVMIVSIIGLALASLTTAASRESGVGSSRVMLRNNLSIALRQLRQDVHEASQILFVKGAMETAPSDSYTPLLVLAQNASMDGDKEIINKTDNDDQVYISYCFKKGEINEVSSGDAVQPSGATDGGIIVRRVLTGQEARPASDEYCSMGDEFQWLQNVKFISSSYDVSFYPVPLFDLSTYKTNDGLMDAENQVDLTRGAILRVNLILELPSYPVVNEVVEERILLSNGGGIFQS